MKYHHQTIKHDPANEQWGDCFRTALACILDLEIEDVPHFMHGNPDSEIVWTQVNKWLNERGLHMMTLPFSGSLSDVLTTMGKLNPGVRYLLAGTSVNGFNHQVIAQGDKIIHDPNRSYVGLTGPGSDGLFWIDVLVPTKIHML